MEKSLRWFKMRTVKNYVGIILCACVIIFIYKTFDISLFSNILSAFIPLIVGAILAYFLQPLVYKFEMFLDSFQNKKLIKYSHTISSIFVFVVFVLIIVVLMIAIIPALVNYVVNIADNLTLYIKNFEKTLETGKMTYFSRSRQELWTKGDTSGHYQYVKSLDIDCDKDTILAKVEQIGAACHTGNRTCFFTRLAEE